MEDHELVVLTNPLPEHGLETGDVGTIVHIYEDSKAYEVEFVTGSGETVAVVTLPPEAIRPVDTTEILHVRKIPA